LPRELRIAGDFENRLIDVADEPGLGQFRRQHRLPEDLAGGRRTWLCTWREGNLNRHRRDGADLIGTVGQRHAGQPQGAEQGGSLAPNPPEDADGAVLLQEIEPHFVRPGRQPIEALLGKGT
jgi:hypothetical protein